MQEGLFVVIPKFWQFRPAFVHQLLSILIICKWTCDYINQVVSGEFPFAVTCSEKNRPEKFHFIATNNWTGLAVQWSVKYFFALNSLIFWKSCTKEEEAEGEKGKHKALCFSSKRNKLLLPILKFHYWK